MRRTVGSVLALVLAGLAAGCGAGQQPSAADQVPGLSSRLQRIDADLAKHRFAAARRDLRSLMAEATSARRAGDLSDPDAQRVLAAATALLDTMPSAASTPSPSSTTGSSPSETSSPTSSPTRKPSRSPKPPAAPSSAPPSTMAPSTTPSPTPTTQQPSPATSTQQSTSGPTAGPTA